MEEKKLKCIKKVMIEVDDNDLNTFIQNEFNQHGFEMVADLEMNDMTAKTFNVKPKEMDQKKLVDFIRYNKGMYITHDLLDQLCFEGKLDEGEYVVQFYS